MPETQGDGENVSESGELKTRLQEWRQGDVITPGVGLFLADLSHPGTDRSRKRGGQPSGAALTALASPIAGLVIISQTCDIVSKKPTDAPFVKAAALVQLDDGLAREARAGDRPRFAHLPLLGPDQFADLDQLVTIEKAALPHLVRTRGIDGTKQQREFSRAVARNMGRFAFPDETSRSLRPIQDRFRERHHKDASDEGRAMRLVEAVMVEALPDWYCEDGYEIRVVFVLARDQALPPTIERDEPPTPTPETTAWFNDRRGPADVAARLHASVDPGDRLWLWDKLVDAWAAKCKCEEPVLKIVCDAVLEDEITFAELANLIPMDLDHLSPWEGHGDGLA